MRLKNIVAKSLVPTGLVVSSILSSGVYAGAKIDMGNSKSIEIGASIRAEMSSVEDKAPNGRSNSFDFDIHSARIYLKASLNEYIGINLQTEKEGEKGMAMIDAYAKFKLSDDLQLWAGRFIPPSDRSNLSGSYNLPVWDYPGKVSSYPNIKAGRDDGLAFIGTPLDGKLVYAIGVFEGAQGTVNPSDEPMFAGRIAYSFWDAEGFLTRSTYYGKKDVFTIGYTLASQSDSVASATDDTDFLAQNIDLLIEKSLGGELGVASFEAALYNYDKNGGDTASKQGDAYLLSTSYLFPQKIGVGQFQLSYRYQEFEPEDSSLDKRERSDVGLTYVIDGHNARVGLYYANEKVGSDDTDAIKLGLQLKL